MDTDASVVQAGLITMKMRQFPGYDGLCFKSDCLHLAEIPNVTYDQDKSWHAILLHFLECFSGYTYFHQSVSCRYIFHLPNILKKMEKMSRCLVWHKTVLLMVKCSRRYCSINICRFLIAGYFHWWIRRG